MVNDVMFLKDYLKMLEKEHERIKKRNIALGEAIIALTKQRELRPDSYGFIPF